jgi:hypothetical protein
MADADLLPIQVHLQTENYFLSAAESLLLVVVATCFVMCDGCSVAVLAHNHLLAEHWHFLMAFHMSDKAHEMDLQYLDLVQGLEDVGVDDLIKSDWKGWAIKKQRFKKQLPGRFIGFKIPGKVLKNRKKWGRLRGLIIEQIMIPRNCAFEECITERIWKPLKLSVWCLHQPYEQPAATLK